MTDIFTTPAGVPFLRTPEARFAGIEDYPWPPSYLEVEPGVRMAYVDAGPADARETLLLLHGEPMWGYLYRKMIGPMVAAGYRVIVPDLIGFGRSDKFVDGARYSYSAHVGWVTSLVRQLDLQHMTIFGQDWGGLIGGRVLAENIERFARAVMSNTALPGVGMAIPGMTAQEPLSPEQLRERFAMDWRETLDDDDSISPKKIQDMIARGPSFYFLAWRVYSQALAELMPSKIVPGYCVDPVSGAVRAAYDAPFPDERYKAAARRLHNASDAPAAHERIEGLENFAKVIDIDQSPIGRTPRSNPATYTGAFQPIRDWFCGLPESKSRGYGPGRFSFNVKGGRCEACQGDGLIKIEMHFLPDVYVTCDVCHGKRYNRETLEVLFKGKSIADVLDMTVDEAAEFFKAVPVLREKMQTLKRVGLGYVKVGQSSTTLSGGEAQRVKLSKELSRRATGKTLYILDEPTTGLHFEDTKKLLEVLHELADQGNTVVVIEHNLDVVKTADWILDFGPEGGDGGGEIVAYGSPEDVASNPKSWTGKYLAELLQRHRERSGVRKKQLVGA